MTNREASELIIKVARNKESSLDLSGYGMSSLPPELNKENLMNLTVLNLNGNKLTSLQLEFENLKNLEELYLSYNQLDSLPSAIGKLINLKELHISNNHLKELPSEIKYLSKLSNLSLNMNEFESFPHQIGNLTNLKILRLTGNRLKRLPCESIKNLTNLEDLQVTQNSLKWPPKYIIKKGTKAILDFCKHPEEIEEEYTGQFNRLEEQKEELESKLEKNNKEVIDRLLETDPKNVQEIAVSEIKILQNFHTHVLEQSTKSFELALIAAKIGLGFFLASVGFILFFQQETAAIITVFSGSLIEVVAGINFYLYGKASNQLSEYHDRIDMTQRRLLANSVCEGLDGDFKQNALSELVKIIAGKS